jgi:hypothetical protein
MKIKGKTYPFSKLNCYLPDTTFDQLEELKEKLGVKDNSLALAILIQRVVAFMKEDDDKKNSLIQRI